MTKKQTILKEPVFSSLSRLEMSKTVMYEFSYGYPKPNNRGKAKLYYMDNDSFIAFIKNIKHVGRYPKRS